MLSSWRSLSLLWRRGNHGAGFDRRRSDRPERPWRRSADPTTALPRFRAGGVLAAHPAVPEATLGSFREEMVVLGQRLPEGLAADLLKPESGDSNITNR